MCSSVSTPTAHVILLPSASDFHSLHAAVPFALFYLFWSDVFSWVTTVGSQFLLFQYYNTDCCLAACGSAVSIALASRITVRIFWFVFLYLHFHTSVMTVFFAISRHWISSQGGFLGFFTFQISHSDFQCAYHVPATMVSLLHICCAHSVPLFFPTSNNLAYICVCVCVYIYKAFLLESLHWASRVFSLALDG